MTSAGTSHIVISTRWNGGRQQETPSLCYAATEQAIQRAFGRDVEQLEVAHNFMISDSGGRSSQAGQDYEVGLVTLQSGFDLPDTEWSMVQPYLTDEMRTILENNYGDLPLTGRLYTTGGVPDTTALISTLDNNGLVAIGDALHWRVIVGYSVGPDGTYTLTVFDPWTGDTTEQGWTAALTGADMTRYVTG